MAAIVQCRARTPVPRGDYHLTVMAIRSTVLTAHPATPADAVRGIEVRLCTLADGALTLTFALAGDMPRIRVPARKEPCRADDLWRHTCFEAFVAADGAPQYCEYNFAPSSRWAAYRFDSYRAGMSVADVRAPRISVQRSDPGLRLEAVIDLPQPRADVSRWWLALAAVIEQDDGSLSYWALAHPPGKPDFHQRAGFVLEL